MISINRYICVAAASVYGGHSMDLTKPTSPTASPSGLPDDNEQKQNKKLVAGYIEDHKSHAPTGEEIGVTSEFVFQWEQMTFGNPAPGLWKNKKFTGSGFALTDQERGTVGSAVWFAHKLELQSSDDEDLKSACTYVVKNLKDPAQWSNTHKKRFKQVMTFKWACGSMTWKKHHCRVTGKVRNRNEIGEQTGVKLSTKDDTQKHVIKIFRYLTLGPREVFDVMNNAPFRIERKYEMLQAIIEVDTLLESAVSRKLLEDVLLDQTTAEGKEHRTGQFNDLKPALIGTPIYHFLVEHKFVALAGEAPTGADQWPPCLLVKPEQAGVDAGAVDSASQSVVANATERLSWWKKGAIRKFFKRAAYLLDRGYSVYRFHGTTATFTHERNGVVRAKSKALWFSAGVQGNTDASFVQMSESSLVQGKTVGIVAGVGGSIYIYCLVLALMYCHPGGIVMLVITAVAALVVAAIQYCNKTSLKSDVVRLTQQVADLKSDKQHLKDFIDTIPHLAKITYRDGADGTDLGEHHVLAVTRNGQRQENTARTQAVASVAQKLHEPDYGTETELPEALKALVQSLESTFGNLEFNEKQTLASALYRNGAQNAGQLVASLNGEFNTF